MNFPSVLQPRRVASGLSRVLRFGITEPLALKPVCLCTSVRRPMVVILVALAALAIGKPASCEGISITNFVLTGTSVSFDINGTFPLTAPPAAFPDSNNLLYFANPNTSASPGFALGDVSYSFSSSFTGSHTLRDDYPVGTGFDSFGDYFFVAFGNSYSPAGTPVLYPGASISGTLNANWTTLAFDPSQVTFLNVFWGTGSPPVLGGGTFLTAVAVPEPSTWVIGLAGITCAGWGMRRRQKHRLVGRSFITTASLALVATCLTTSPAHAVTIDWVTVGDAGAYYTSGGVEYEYQIMKFEWTNSQYVQFLNAVDPDGTNPNSIYNDSMGSNDPFPVSIPALMRELGNSPRGVSEGGA